MPVPSDDAPDCSVLNIQWIECYYIPHSIRVHSRSPWPCKGKSIERQYGGLLIQTLKTRGVGSWVTSAQSMSQILDHFLSNVLISIVPEELRTSNCQYPLQPNMRCTTYRATSSSHGHLPENTQAGWRCHLVFNSRSNLLLLQATAKWALLERLLAEKPARSAH
jgi:hypothetical protein